MTISSVICLHAQLSGANVLLLDLYTSSCLMPYSEEGQMQEEAKLGRGVAAAEWSR